MKDILLKRNDLKIRSSKMRTMRFEPNIKDSQVDKIVKEQDKLYKQWNFYDKYIKAREEVKNEIKSYNVGKSK